MKAKPFVIFWVPVLFGFKLKYQFIYSEGKNLIFFVRLHITILSAVYFPTNYILCVTDRTLDSTWI